MILASESLASVALISGGSPEGACPLWLPSLFSVLESNAALWVG